MWLGAWFATLDYLKKSSNGISGEATKGAGASKIQLNLYALPR